MYSYQNHFVSRQKCNIEKMIIFNIKLMYKNQKYLKSKHRKRWHFEGNNCDRSQNTIVLFKREVTHYFSLLLILFFRFLIWTSAKYKVSKYITNKSFHLTVRKQSIAPTYSIINRLLYFSLYPPITSPSIPIAQYMLIINV